VGKAERDTQVALLSAQGVMNKDIAERLKIGINTVKRILKKPEVQRLVKQTRGEINLAIEEVKRELPAQIVEKVAKSLAERMDEAADDAFERLTELVRGAKSETVQFKAVESILDRSTSAPKREIHSSRTVDVEQRMIKITLTADDLAQLRSGYLEEEPDDMIDVMPYRPPERPLTDVLAELKAAVESER